MSRIIESLHGFIWGTPTIILIMCMGCYLTVATGFVQLRLLPLSFRMLRERSSVRGVSPFRALCTALSATVGTGNLVGVSSAICLGGPGAVFWMHICGFLGMAVKYAETVLAVRYRHRKGSGYAGGPMYYMEAAFRRKHYWVSSAYALFGLLACFGIGTATQVNAISAGIRNICHIPAGIVGIFIAICVGAVLIGGISAIGKIAERVVPIATGAYVVMCLSILFLHVKALPNAVVSIMKGAFSPKAVTGGCIGNALRTLQYGCSRGVFSNEAGLGTAAIAHASAEINHPNKQGAMGILEVFIDTFLICTLTALAILCCGIPIPYGKELGAELLTQAFSSCFPYWGNALVSVFLICFAYATILGWSLYGARFAEFLFGEKACKAFFVIQTLSIPMFAVMNTQTAWMFAATANGLMLLPNLAAISLLNSQVIELSRDVS